MDEPDQVIRLISDYPEFKAMYDDLYQMCLNTEKVMEMFSKELQILDENTVQYMMDEMQGTIDGMQGTIDGMQGTIDGMQGTIDELQGKLEDKDAMIQELQWRLEEAEKGNKISQK